VLRSTCLELNLLSFTPPPFIGDGGQLANKAEISSACAAGSNQTGCWWSLINTGYCGQNYVVLSATFVGRYVVLHSSIYPCCLLVVVLLYSLIYRAVLAQSSRRQTMRASVALTKPPTSPPPPPANPTEGRLPSSSSCLFSENTKHKQSQPNQ